MFAPEYRVGLRVLVREIGFIETLRVVIPAVFSSLGPGYQVDDGAPAPEITKAELKNHFELLALLYREIEIRFSAERADGIMKHVLLEGGRVFFRGFRPLDADASLQDFVQVYTDFESNNIVFDVLEESGTRFEIDIKRCLVFEAFEELGAPGLSKYMCDVATEFFREYHPRLRYAKDRMIARGDTSCHELFTWH